MSAPCVIPCDSGSSDDEVPCSTASFEVPELLHWVVVPNAGSEDTVDLRDIFSAPHGECDDLSSESEPEIEPLCPPGGGRYSGNTVTPTPAVKPSAPQTSLPPPLAGKKRKRRGKKSAAESPIGAQPTTEFRIGLTRNQKTNERRRENRAFVLATTPSVAGELRIRRAVSQMHAQVLTVEVARAVELGSLPAAKNGFIAVPFVRAPYVRSYQRVKWSGRVTNYLIAGPHRQVVAVLAGRPPDPTWDTDCAQLARVTSEMKPKITFKPDTRKLRGSTFNAMHAGVSFGGGQGQPGYLSQPAENLPLIDAFIRQRVVRRIVGFANLHFALGAPLLYREYTEVLDRFYAHYPSLSPPFVKSVWTAFSINFPPRAFCKLHRDTKNKAVGWCAVFAGGDYDHEQGGHLKLPQLGLEIEFPPNSVILIPSALLVHGNRPVSKHESRFVMTMYTAGGIFRHTEYDFQTEEYLQKHEPEKWAEHEAKNATRFESELALWSRVENLHNDRVSAGLCDPEEAEGSTG